MESVQQLVGAKAFCSVPARSSNAQAQKSFKMSLHVSY